jgi:hypothetical protein
LVFTTEYYSAFHRGATGPVLDGRLWRSGHKTQNVD